MENDIVIQFNSQGSAPRLAFKDEYGNTLFYFVFQRDENEDFRIEIQDKYGSYLGDTIIFSDTFDDDIISKEC